MYLNVKWAPVITRSIFFQYTNIPCPGGQKVWCIFVVVVLQYCVGQRYSGTWYYNDACTISPWYVHFVRFCCWQFCVSRFFSWNISIRYQEKRHSFSAKNTFARSAAMKLSNFNPQSRVGSRDGLTILVKSPITATPDPRRPYKFCLHFQGDTCQSNTNALIDTAHGLHITNAFLVPQ